MPEITAAEAGCWIDGTWGQYGPARVIQLASYHGYGDVEVIEAADAKLKSMGPTIATVTDEQEELVLDAVDEAESWLNEHVAPKGYSFGWCDGEFFLWSDKEWSEAYQ